SLAKADELPFSKIERVPNTKIKNKKLYTIFVTLLIALNILFFSMGHNFDILFNNIELPFTITFWNKFDLYLNNEFFSNPVYFLKISIFSIILALLWKLISDIILIFGFIKIDYKDISITATQSKNTSLIEDFIFE